MAPPSTLKGWTCRLVTVIVTESEVEALAGTLIVPPQLSPKPLAAWKGLVVWVKGPNVATNLESSVGSSENLTSTVSVNHAPMGWSADTCWGEYTAWRRTTLLADDGALVEEE